MLQIRYLYTDKLKFMKKAFICSMMVLVITACSKFSGDDYVNFSSAGGPWSFDDVEIDASTLTIADGKEFSTAEYWPEASVDSDALWTAEISWAYVSYQPSKKLLYLRAEPNEYGAKRSSTISANSCNSMKHFHIHQSQ